MAELSTRRQVLAALAGTGLSGLAGCSSGGDDGDDQDPTGSGTTQPGTMAGMGTAEPTAMDSPCPTPAETTTDQFTPASTNGFEQQDTRPSTAGVGRGAILTYAGPDGEPNDVGLIVTQGRDRAQQAWEDLRSQLQYAAAGYFIVTDGEQGTSFLVVVDAQSRDAARTLLTNAPAISSACLDAQLTFVRG